MIPVDWESASRNVHKTMMARILYFATINGITRNSTFSMNPIITNGWWCRQYNQLDPTTLFLKQMDQAMRVYVHVHISVFRYQLCLCFYNILIGFYDSPEGVVLTCQSLPRVVGPYIHVRTDNTGQRLWTCMTLMSLNTVIPFKGIAFIFL